jgi:quinol monooxygenase YgiN
MPITVIEVRNYLIKPGMRDHFTDNFEAHFIASQEAQGMSILGQFRVIGEPDHYVWLRGFSDMESRQAGLQNFYFGPVWKKYRELANGMIIDSDNVHLLRPLNNIADLMCGLNAEIMAADLDAGTISPSTGTIAIDFYQAKPGQRQALIDAFQSQIMPAYQREGIQVRGCFVAEMNENTFPKLPVIQNPDMLVVITAYESEQACGEKRELILPTVNAAIGALINVQDSLLLAPTLRSAMRYVNVL